MESEQINKEDLIEMIIKIDELKLKLEQLRGI